MIKTYLQVTQAYKIEQPMPQLTKMFKGWEKKEETKKSKVFTREQINTFLSDAPDDDTYLPIKAALVIGIYGCLRKTELAQMQFESIQYVQEINAFKATIQRKKQKGPQANSTFMIMNELDTRTLQNYIQVFQKEVSACLQLQFTKNFPEYLHFTSNHTIVKSRKQMRADCSESSRICIPPSK